MNTPNEFETRVPERTTSLLQTVLTTSLAQEAYDIVRHLGRVVDVRAGDQVLLVPGDGALSALTLVNDFGCTVTVLIGPGDEPAVQPADERIQIKIGRLEALPFEKGTFDAVIVAVPLTAPLQRSADEMARVLKRSGRLGIIALSPYRDQMADEANEITLQGQGIDSIRPAAAYRAVLGEAGFTAFVTEDRRRALRRSAQAIYQEHMLKPGEPTTATLELFAAGGVSMTLITAEKGL